ncbi:MAG: hypothetical protein P4L55_18365 [Syntrophobacteraceae bacterium]|nr:hypothetical protein [Syntrophobacteraceae bacterium]
MLPLWRKPIKWSVFVLTVLLAGLAIEGFQACAGSYPPARPPESKSQSTHSRKAVPTLLADRTETRDSITYTTDPNLERAMKKEDREEQEKENKSWKMLQNMPYYAPAHKRHPYAQPGTTVPQ